MGAVGVLVVVLTAGCASVKEMPPGVMAQSVPLTESTTEAAGALAQPAARPRLPVMAADEALRTEPAADAAIPPARPAVAGTAARAASPRARIPARIFGSAAFIEPPRKSEVPRPVAKAPEPMLDVSALIARLRDTSAIGVFTKLALKIQMDDLLQLFRAHYLNGQKASVASLRPPYDMLLLRVLVLIQENDPLLARTISGSREAIWGILADPEKFKSVS